MRRKAKGVTDGILVEEKGIKSSRSEYRGIFKRDSVVIDERGSVVKKVKMMI